MVRTQCVGLPTAQCKQTVPTDMALAWEEHDPETTLPRGRRLCQADTVPAPECTLSQSLDIGPAQFDWKTTTSFHLPGLL